MLLSRGGRTAGRQGWVLVIEEETEALMGKEGCWPLSGGVGKGSPSTHGCVRSGPDGA